MNAINFSSSSTSNPSNFPASSLSSQGVTPSAEDRVESIRISVAQLDESGRSPLQSPLYCCTRSRISQTFFPSEANENNVEKIKDISQEIIFPGPSELPSEKKVDEKGNAAKTFQIKRPSRHLRHKTTD